MYDARDFSSGIQINELAHDGDTKLVAPVDISKFLWPAGVLELRYCRMLSDLCSMTYRMHTVNVCEKELRATYLLSFL